MGERRLSSPGHHSITVWKGYPIAVLRVLRRMFTSLAVAMPPPFGPLVTLPRENFAASPYCRAHCSTSTRTSMPPAPTLQDALLPFQREGVAAAVERWDGRILLGDEMGLGKTIQVSN